MSMKRETAIRRLTKRAREFYGMTLKQYLRTFVYKTDDGRMVLNDNGSMQKCFYRLLEEN